MTNAQAALLAAASKNAHPTAIIVKAKELLRWLDEQDAKATKA